MEHDQAGLYQIWKDAFNVDDQYFEFFIKEGLPLGRLLTYGPSETPYSALTLFPISYEQAGVLYSGYYLYALGTLLSKRGKGYGRMLLKKAEEYAIDTDRQFILLQPANFVLFRYYQHIGYHTSVLRASMKCTKANLCSLSPDGKSLQRTLSKISVPCGTNSRISSEPQFDHFIWSPLMRQYIQKECLFRGGAVLYNAFCYPNVDYLGSFLEIKEFQSSFYQIPILVESLLTTFSHIDRFFFYGISQHVVENGISQEAFSLIRFFNSALQKKYNTKSYFALGLD